MFRNCIYLNILLTTTAAKSLEPCAWGFPCSVTSCGGAGDLELLVFAVKFSGS